MLQETFDSLAQDRDMTTVLLSAITAERERRGQPQAPRRPRRGGDGRGKVDYASPEHAGEPHRDRITEAEKSYVREHLDEVKQELWSEPVDEPSHESAAYLPP